MKKKFLTAFIIACTFIMSMGIINVSAGTYEDLTYTVSNGKVTITDCNEAATSVDIPSTIEDSPVTSIGFGAFFNCKSLTSITIPDSVRSIGNAFSFCSSLTSINVDNNNQYFSSSDGVLFNKNQTELISFPEGKGENYIIPNTVTSIGEDAFSRCKCLTSITIPDSVTSIGNSAFYWCSSLTSVTIGDSVTSIGEQAFYDCSSLTRVTIGDSVTSIGEDAFYNCHNLSVYITDLAAWCEIEFYNYNSNPLRVGKLYLNNELVTDLVVPDSVTSIGSMAFYNYNSLTSVKIGDGVRGIGRYAFSYCSSLTSVTIGDGVTSIGSDAFSYCPSLTSIKISDNIKSIGAGAFIYTGYYKNPDNWEDGVLYIGKYLISAETTITECEIKGDTLLISELAFINCSSLTSITIPESLTSIGNRAFYNCLYLTEINWNAKNVSALFPNSNIFYKAGQSGDGITVTFGKNVESIPGNAFAPNSYDTTSSAKIKSVTIGDNVARIGYNAFANCLYLTEINWNAKNVSALLPNSNIFYNAGQNGNGVNVTFGDKVEAIPENAFSNCSSLTSVKIGDSVRSIGVDAFYNTGYYKNPDNWEDGVLYLGKYLICAETTITECEIKGGTLLISDSAFRECDSLTSITIPDSVTSIGEQAFYYCRGLTSITIPDGVMSIGDYVFCYCSSLTSVTIGDSVTSIGAYSFYGCNRLKDVYYVGGVEEWNKIEIEEGNSFLTDATIHYNYSPFDSLFEGSAYDYNHLLARTTFEFVEAGFSATTDEFTKGGSDTSNIAKKRYTNIKNKYDEYGFTDNQKFYNYGIALTDTSDKAAYSIASKDITINGKTKKLVALVVRGGNYGGEWVSNFNVGADSTYSQGFKKPADDIIKKLKSYISAYKSKDVILWMTGYSRGAAIANLVAANMVDYSKNCSYLDAENIYAYTFATPNPVHRKNSNAGNPKYNNIFNIVNPADPVPYVLLSDWGYSKFGTTKTILSSVPTAVKNKYKEITGKTYSISQEQRSAVSNLIKLLSNLADTKQEFYNRYAEPIKDIIHWLMVDKKVDKNATLIEHATTKYASSDIVRSYQYASADVDAYKKVLKKAGITDEYIKLAKEIGMILELNGTSMDEFLDDLTGNNALSLLKSVFKIISSISSLDGQFAGLGAVHESDTYRAWLFGLGDPEKIYGSTKSAEELLNENTNKYKKQLIQCPVDVEVTDAEGNVVVSVVDHEILVDEIPVVVIDDKTIIYYYDNFEDYNVNITAYEDGEVNYYVSEYATGTEETKRVCYNDIEVSANDKLTGSMNDEIDTDIANYNLSLSENIIENTEILADEQLDNLSVTVNEEGSGTATEIINASKGDYITLVATPYVGAEFIGWYNGEICLSKNSEYSFVIENNCMLTAKFTVTDVEISDITIPEISHELICSKVSVTANNDFSGNAIWKAYDGEILVSESESNVSITDGESKELTVQFMEDETIDRITVCLYDSNDIAKTTVLSVSLVRELPTVENSSYKYVIHLNNKIEIIEIKDNIGEEFEIPNMVDGYEVFAISENLFKDKKELTEIIVPETVTQIDVSAFEGCENLKWLSFKGSVEEWNCVTLNVDELPEKVSIATSYENTPAKIHSVSLFNENEKEFATINFDYLKEDASVYLAIYDTTGKMNFIKHNVVNSGERSIDFEIDVGYDIEKSYLRAFCWSEENKLMPLCQSYKSYFIER